MSKLGIIVEWLNEKNWKPASSMTDLVWDNSNYFSRLTQNKTDPRYDMTLDEHLVGDVDSDFYLHLFFKSPDDAMLFKLTWGGQ